MRNNPLILCLLAVSISVSAQQKNTITQTGYSFLPFPIVAFDADKGVQYGVFAGLYNYGDGDIYPDYHSKTYVEAYLFSKGSQMYNLMYDNVRLIPDVRLSAAFSTSIDKAMDFYGFNGYSAFYDYERIALGKANAKSGQDPAKHLYGPFYKVDRIQILGKTDFIGRLTEHLSWEAGYHFSYFREGSIDKASINKGKAYYNQYPEDEPTLFDLYRKWGLIDDCEADGGFSSSVRLGLVYDSRDKEGAPTKGIWAEGHICAAPKFLGTKNPFYRYSITFRQYFPLIGNDVLTFAYRLNYEGNIGKNAPYYILPYLTLMGENCDKDGMGGYRTTRGIMRNRVVGLDTASYIAELRWRVYNTTFWGQNIALGLSAFSDGTMVTRGRDLSYSGPDEAVTKESYDRYISNGHSSDIPHITVGAGIRLLINESLILTAEYGTPLSHFYPAGNPLKNQDGAGAFYVSSGYLF